MAHSAKIIVTLYWCSVFLLGFSHASESEAYLLRYRFTPNETLRWSVVQRIDQVTSVRGHTERVHSTSRSSKVWTVREVANTENSVGKLRATLVYNLDDVVMFKRQTDFADSSYDSRRDTVVPPAFRTVADLLRRPLAEFTFDDRGTIIKRVHFAEYAAGTEENRLVIPLPEAEVCIGESWFTPKELAVPRPDGTVRKIAARERFTLASVKTGWANVTFVTQLLTPIGRPQDEMAIRDKLTSGSLRLDLDTGRLVSQRTTIDRTIVGFEGGASSTTYRMELDECCCGFKTCTICTPEQKKLETTHQELGE